MIRLHITAEGQTEESFVKNTLSQWLYNYNVFADVRCVRTSKNHRGGMTNYAKAKNDINQWLKEERHNNDVFFSTMFDYYALPNDFPGYQLSKQQSDAYKKVEIIEQAFANDIGDNRFIPYIQLHEFESLLFSNPQKFEIEYFDSQSKIDELKKIVETFSNPELINNGHTTAPSKRIIDKFPNYEYNKPIIGSSVAREIGMDCLKQSCKHFAEWVHRLETLH